jgi:type I restriction enzyme S subunit
MSRIDDLMRELCPEGVPLALLGDGVNNRDNERRPVTRELRQSGIYPYYGANGVQDYVQDFIFDGEFLLVGEDGSVIEASGAPVLNWAEGKIWVNNHAHVLQERTGGPILRFLYFYLSTINVSAFVTGGSQKKINQGNLNNIPIPRPPLEVQREIVSILDKFTQLEAELDAELEARRSQYEHTRGQLLDFSGDLSSHPMRELIAEFCPNGVPRSSIGELCKVETGKRDANEGSDDGQYHFFTTAKKTGRIDTYRWDCDALLIAGNANIGNVKQYNGKFDAYQRTYVLSGFRPDVDVRYLYFALSDTLNFYLDANKNVAAMTYIVLKTLVDFEVPVPPLEVQREIVSILDKLDALVNDLTFGLPAEIAARRKQYEYYRNKLLTFKELETA